MPSCVDVNTYLDWADAMSNASVHIPSSRAKEGKKKEMDVGSCECIFRKSTRTALRWPP